MTEKNFEVREFVTLTEDVYITKPAVGKVLYASKGDTVQIMSYDPSKAPEVWGVRAKDEPYRNAPVKDTDICKNQLWNSYSAQSVGL
ncbi:hypothetical protein [Pseudomonas phage D6]|nr:hypothetical protein [Pseudomonas phage D6]